MRKIEFGTGGWRAIIGDGFTRDNIRLLTAGLCALMDEDGLQGSTVCVGYDRRFLSKEAQHWAAEVLVGHGYHALVVNRACPTPLVMFTVKQRHLPYGMAITASHNPAIYNGIKLFTAGGRDADEAFTRRVEAKIATLSADDVPSVDYESALARGMISEENPTNAYIDSILSAIDVSAIQRAQLRVALDPLYGVSQTCLSTILLTCRCELEVIHGQHDTLFGGHLPAPTAETLGPLAAVVMDRHRCDLGIATDGDADRLGVIDDQGAYVHPNQLLVMLYVYLARYRGMVGPCVRNNSTTHLLDRVAADMGQPCYEVPVGFKHISAKMAQTHAVIGGESSGGLAVRGHISGKDGIYAAALLVEMLAVTGQSLSAFYADILRRYGALHYAEASFTMTPERKAALQAQLAHADAAPDFGREVARVSLEDGFKVYFDDDSWVICRFSGTEPLLRMAAEAESPETARHYMAVWQRKLGL